MIVERLQTIGCLRLIVKRVQDERGEFVKPYVAAEYQSLGLPTQFAEEYYSVSTKNVLRGLHFQTPPHEHHKLVACILGSIRDVILDMRSGSPTYGRAEMMDLSESDHSVLYLPAGIAHGFLVLSDSAMVSYKVTSAHDAEHDSGIRWDSIGVDWGCDAPITSARDASFPMWDQFQSPFVFKPEESA